MAESGWVRHSYRFYTLRDLEMLAHEYCSKQYQSLSFSHQIEMLNQYTSPQGDVLTKHMSFQGHFSNKNPMGSSLGRS